MDGRHSLSRWATEGVVGSGRFGEMRLFRPEDGRCKNTRAVEGRHRTGVGGASTGEGGRGQGRPGGAEEHLLRGRATAEGIRRGAEVDKPRPQEAAADLRLRDHHRDEQVPGQ